jgi:hypothetical protein
MQVNKYNENQEMSNTGVNTFGGRVAVAAQLPAVPRYQSFVSVDSRRFRRADRCTLDSLPWCRSLLAVAARLIEVTQRYLSLTRSLAP